MAFWKRFLPELTGETTTTTTTTETGTPPFSESSVEDLAREEAIKIIKATWIELMRKKEEVGLRIYQEVLLKEVEMSRLFLRTRIDKQSDAFMSMLNTVVGYLDDLNTLDEKLRNLGATHMTRYHVKRRHFKHFRTAFMRAIKQYIPWTDRREAAWMWFWSRIIDRMSADNSFVPFAQDITPQQYIEYSKAVHETFDNVIAVDPQRFSASFYKVLLESQPDIANLFKNTEFQQQGPKFISMVRHCINLLDEPRTFEFKMIELGKMHNTFGVNISQLQAFGDVLTDCIRKHNPLKWTEEHTKAWKWFWKIVVNLFSRGMLEYIEEKKDQEELNRERFKYLAQDSTTPNSGTDEIDNQGEYIFDVRGRYTLSKFLDSTKEKSKLYDNSNDNNTSNLT